MVAMMTTDQEQQAARQIEAQPGPNHMGRDKMQIVETRYVHPWGDEAQEPVKVVHRGPWFMF